VTTFVLSYAVVVAYVAKQPVSMTEPIAVSEAESATVDEERADPNKVLLQVEDLHKAFPVQRSLYERIRRIPARAEWRFALCKSG
jgi:hypothetical protein